MSIFINTVLHYDFALFVFSYHVIHIAMSPFSVCINSLYCGKPSTCTLCLGKFEVTEWAINAVPILMDHWTVTARLAVTVSKIVIRVVNHITFTLHFRTKISDVDELRWRIKNEWTVWIMLITEHAACDAVSSTCLCSCWRQTFWAYALKMMWLTTFHDFWDNCQSILYSSMIH